MESSLIETTLLLTSSTRIRDIRIIIVKMYTNVHLLKNTLSDALPRLQVLSMSEEFRRALYANAISLDNDVIVPDLIGTTEILSDEHREQLCRHLPARAEGYQWTLVFSTSQHGFSLNSMYRKMAKVESPILLVIEDTEGNVSSLFLNLNCRNWF